MSAGNVFENDIAKLIFQAVPIPNIADNAAGSPLTSIYVSLHVGDPGEAGSQTTNEATYTGYGRKAVLRSSSGFTVTGSSVSNAADIVFDPCSGGVNSISHFAIGTVVSGAGKILVSGALTTPLAVSSGVVPTFPAGTLTATVD